jgi:hypothetical protein
MRRVETSLDPAGKECLRHVAAENAKLFLRRSLGGQSQKLVQRSIVDSIILQ